MLLLPERVMHLWTGTDGPDYDRACAINDYLGVVVVGDEEGLVINDEPASTAIFSAREGDSVVIAKWTYGPDATSVARSLQDVQFRAFPPPDVRMTFGSSPQILFESSFAGSECIRSRTACLRPGRYAASTLTFEPATDIALVLHWLRPTQE